MYYAVKQNETYLFRNKFFLYIGYIYINFWSIWNLLIEKYGALFRKKITFLRTKYFFDAASSCFCRQEIIFCATLTSFWWHEILFRATSTRFRRNQITFCATSNVLFQHKITFRATANFCFEHRLECYVMVIYFYCHVATKI